MNKLAPPPPKKFERAPPRFGRVSQIFFVRVFFSSDASFTEIFAGKPSERGNRTRTRRPGTLVDDQGHGDFPRATITINSARESDRRRTVPNDGWKTGVRRTRWCSRAILFSMSFDRVITARRTAVLWLARTVYQPVPAFSPYHGLRNVQ